MLMDWSCQLDQVANTVIEAPSASLFGLQYRQRKLGCY